MGIECLFSSRRGAHRRLPHWLAAMALGGAALSAQASELRAPAQPTVDPPGRPRVTGPNLLSKTEAGDGSFLFNARFRGFYGNFLSVTFTMPATWSRAAAQRFGIAPAEVDAIAARCQAALGCDQRVLHAELQRYFHARGVRVRTRDNGHARVVVDVPAVVARHRESLAPMADALRALAGLRGENTRWLLEAAIALVQGGVAYGRPGEFERGRRIMGFYPPPATLARGYGDCDTKSALLAALLQNLTDAPLIGIDLPNHYLLGIAATPRGDQAWLHYKGASYVLVEAVGPALRRPGEVSAATLVALNNPGSLRIDPMY